MPRKRKATQETSPALPLPTEALASALAVVDDAVAAEKRIKTGSVQDEKYNQSVEAAYTYYVSLVTTSKEVPEYGDPSRDVYLSSVWPIEPILAGAVYSMVAKAGAWNYTLTGGRNAVSRAQSILVSANAGEGWTRFIQKFVLDLLTTDRGAFAEVAHADKSGNGPVIGIFNFDALRCRTTGNAEWPAVWQDDRGKWRKLPASIVVHQSIMPSPRDEWKGIGYCPVSRALSAAQVLLLLSQYDRQKLSNLPPDGIISVSGLSLDQLKKAFALYEAHRANKGASVFSGLLWLAGGGVGNIPNVDVKLTAFSQIPEQFDRALTVEIYAKTVALCFGIDVGEIWLVQHSGATKASETIQHQKAKGKGPGDIAAGIERWVNWNILPPGVDFAFDLRDDSADLGRAQIRNLVTSYVRRLWEPSPQTQMGIITDVEARQLLAEEGVIPQEMSETAPTIVDDVEQVLREKAYASGEDVVMIDRHGVVRREYSAKKVFSHAMVNEQSAA